MTTHTNTVPDNAQRVTAPQSLADLKAFIQDDANLGPQRRRDLRSAIATLASFLGEPAEAVPADARILRPRLKRLHHAQLGVSKKRLSNVTSDTLAAIKRANKAFPDRMYRGELTPAWRELHARLPRSSKYAYHLNRALRCFAGDGPDPEAVDDSAFERYRAHLEQFNLRRDPRKAHRDACRLWNRAVDNLTGWPQQRVSEPQLASHRKHYPLEALPESFQADLKALHHRLIHGNPFAGKLDEGSTSRRPRRTTTYASTTARQWTLMLSRGASVLVLEGTHTIDEITNVGVVCEPAAAETILTHYWQAAGEQPTKHTQLLAYVLKTVAELHVGASGAQLADLAQNIPVMSPAKTPKNYARLRQLCTPENKLLFLECPQRLCETAEASGLDRKSSAVDLLVAATMAILTYAPLRSANLVDLRRHEIRWPSARGEPAHIVIPGNKVKNNHELFYELPAEVVVILRRYLEIARPWWLAADDTRVFPFRNDDDGKDLFNRFLKDRVWRETGLVVNTHLFRHIAAKLYLDANPGDYETVRLMLGHERLNTTIDFYCGLEREAAIRHYDEVVLNLHKHLQDTASARPQRASRSTPTKNRRTGR